MPLYVILGITGLNTIFYIGFAFLSSETYTNYYWALSFLQKFYYEGDIPDLVFVGTNYEKVLIRALKTIMPNSKHALYLWHIDKNLFSNYKSSFDIEEA